MPKRSGAGLKRNPILPRPSDGALAHDGNSETIPDEELDRRKKQQTTNNKELVCELRPYQSCTMTWWQLLSKDKQGANSNPASALTGDLHPTYASCRRAWVAVDAGLLAEISWFRVCTRCCKPSSTPREVSTTSLAFAPLLRTPACWT